MIRKQHKIEITAPVGSYEALQAAISAKADSIYFGIGSLHMRSNATSTFSLSDIGPIVRLCHKHGMKAYLALNSLLYDSDMTLMQKICQKAKDHKIDAIIASDIATILYAHSIQLPIHISTQLNITNMKAVEFYSQYADTIVLARELSLDQIHTICKGIEKNSIQGPAKKNVQIEIFIHGALCMAIAGTCAMSLSLYNFSSNRGQCLQPCRRKFRVIDEETQDELMVDNHYVFSPKDLATIGCLDQIIDSGVSILKIEGRARGAEYVYATVKAYKEALESLWDGTYSPQRIEKWTNDLKTVYNRGLWQGGYYLGSKTGEWSATYGSQSTKKKIYIGKITNYFTKLKVVEIKLEAGLVEKGDEILITGKTTGVFSHVIDNLRLDTENKEKKGRWITFPLEKKVRRNDCVFLLKNTEKCL